MSRVEFNMQVKLNDYLTREYRNARKSRSYHRYLIIVMLVIVITSCQEIIYTGDLHDTIGVSVMFLCVSFIFALYEIRYRVHSRLNKLRRHKYIIYFVDEQGYGYRSNLCDYCTYWAAASDIIESDDYIDIKSDIFPMNLHKYLIDSETLLSVKKILANVPIENKQIRDV
ncbi:MAG: hypothetical protein ACYTA5_09105 [Planctomycetota bacterium]|jgi:hypothetical protein